MTCIRETASTAIVFCFCTLPVAGQDVAPPENKEDFHLFLLAGQSNMAGRGRRDDTDVMPRPNVMMLDQSNRWVPAVDPPLIGRRDESSP